MSNSVIAIAARFSRRPAPPVQEAEVLLPENDLEFLAREIERMRSAKAAADGAKMRSDIAAEEAQSDLNKAIDAYEEEVKRRGLLCRK